jgi:hypothetical protein
LAYSVQGEWHPQYNLQLLVGGGHARMPRK